MDWPDKKTRIHEENDPRGMQIPCNPKWALMSNFTDEDVSFSYKRAAELIISQYKCESWIDKPDLLYMPIMLLYRHSIEILLKEFVRLGASLGEIGSQKAEEHLDNHAIYPLWNLVKPMIQARNEHGDKNILSNAETIISDLHKSDKNGQEFRYSMTKMKKSTFEKYPSHVDLETIRRGISELHTFLSGCICQAQSGCY